MDSRLPVATPSHLSAAARWRSASTTTGHDGELHLSGITLRQRSRWLRAGAADGGRQVFVGDAGGGEGVTENARISRAGYGDGFERERMAEDFEAGLREGVVVDAARIAQQGAVDVEEIGVVVVPGQAGTPGRRGLAWWQAIDSPPGADEAMTEFGKAAGGSLTE